MKQVLRKDWVERIFSRLLGIYGAQFKSKFSSVENGIDVGIENAKDIWAEELGTFGTRPDAIQYALENLPSERAPNAIEFRDICRRAPKPEIASITYQPTAEDLERNRRMAEKATKAVTNHVDPMHCWLHPKSQIVADYLFDAHKNPSRFRRLAEIFDRHVKNEVITPAGKLLYKWNGLGWQKS